MPDGGLALVFLGQTQFRSIPLGGASRSTFASRKEDKPLHPGHDVMDRRLPIEAGFVEHVKFGLEGAVHG